MIDAPALDTWNAVLGDLQLQVTRPTYETWLRDTAGIRLQEHLLTVEVPTPFAMEWLERRMYHLIQTTAQKVIGRPVDIHFQVGDAIPHNGRGESGPARQKPLLGNPQMYNLNTKYTFNTFVVGPSNRLSYSAARAAAESQGQTYSPLFLYSGVGLGKTHLLHAIAHTCVERDLRFLYVTCEQFTNEFIAAIRNRTTEEFRGRYKSLDMLLIDDIQFISGKEQTQEAFFHIFNDLHTADKPVVLTSDRPPKALSMLEDRLSSRFQWGLIADIQPPDLETRMAILRTKADQMQMNVDDTVIEYVAKKVQKNVRELEGSLNGIAALARLMSSPVTLSLAAEVISNLAPDRSRRSVDPEKIIEEVTLRFRVGREDLMGTSRKKNFVRARHVAMYLLKEELGMRDTQIGRLVGGRDHSTVISAVGKVNYNINVDPQLRRDVLAIKEALFSE